jgi:ribosomal protein S18 acetylase RimI-like enzyme
VTTRPASGEDEPFLLRLTTRLGEFPLPHWRTPDEVARADHAILLAALKSGSDDTAILVAELAGAGPAGYIFATTRRDYFTGKPHAHVEVLAVEPAAEGRGVARVLMTAIEDWAAGRGYRAVTLNVFERNDRARALYQRLGYQVETLQYLKPLPGPPRP